MMDMPIFLLLWKQVRAKTCLKQSGWQSPVLCTGDSTDGVLSSCTEELAGPGKHICCCSSWKRNSWKRYMAWKRAKMNANRWISITAGGEVRFVKRRWVLVGQQKSDPFLFKSCINTFRGQFSCKISTMRYTVIRKGTKILVCSTDDIKNISGSLHVILEISSEEIEVSRHNICTYLRLLIDYILEAAWNAKGEKICKTRDFYRTLVSKIWKVTTFIH